MPRLAADDSFDAAPTHPVGCGVLLLAGSSGRIETERAALLAAHGAHARAIRWFGGRDQRPAPHEVPIELFMDELDRLRRDHDRVAIFGTSFGAEAALVTAGVTRVDATIAVAPSSVVWSGWNDGWSSHWTLGGEPVPAVRFHDAWTPTTDPPEYRSLYERSLAMDPALTAAASIPVERILGDLVLIAGGDDRVWPGERFAEEIARRRTAHGAATAVVLHPRAGHRVVLPGERPATGGVRMARGGTPDADAELGALAWPEIVRVLGLSAGRD